MPRSGEGADPCIGLSNDYLNHFSEVLMLIELAPFDVEAAADELSAWRPIPYPAYFQVSNLRRAPEALAAYLALPDERRTVFEELIGAMDRLATTAIRALRPPCEAEEAALVADVTAPALRRLIGRAAAFLNSGGRVVPEGEVEEAQAVIDDLIERVRIED